MPINILMPALSPTMEKGNLAKWLKKEGDKVKSGDVIAEIETDKATMEVEAVDEGTLAKIVVPEGTQDVPVNELIAVLAGDGEDVKAAGASAGSAKAAAQPPKAEAPAPKPVAAAPAPAPAAAAPAPGAAPQPAAPASQANGHGRIFSSPLARRLSKEAGIELGRIDGSGPHGRIIARDVADAKSGKGLKAPTGAPSGASALAPSMSDKQILALFEPGSYEIVPHDGMRRTIAQRLTASIQNVRISTSPSTATSAGCLTRASRSMRPRRRTRRRSRSTRFRSTTSSSRRWRWLCRRFRTATSAGPKAA